MTRVKFQVLLVLISFLQVAVTFNENYSTPVIAQAPAQSQRLYFGLMLSLSGDEQSSGALAGVQAALDEINSRDDLLPGYFLNFTLINVKVYNMKKANSFYMGHSYTISFKHMQCDRRTALDGLFSQLLQTPHQIIALIGSGCSASTSDAAVEIAHYYSGITSMCAYLLIIIVQ